jgi:hypothetical protein
MTRHQISQREKSVEKHRPDSDERVAVVSAQADKCTNEAHLDNGHEHPEGIGLFHEEKQQAANEVQTLTTKRISNMSDQSSRKRDISYQ